MTRSFPLPGAVFFCAFLSLAAAPSAFPADSSPLYVPGRILVRYRDGSASLRSLDVPLVRRAGRPVPLVPHAARYRPGRPSSDPLARTVQVDVPEGTNVLDAVTMWSRQPDVEYAGPVHLIPLADASGAAATPADPDLPSQWQHDSIRSREAWDVTHGDSSVVIGIVDTGVDYNHPDLRGNLWINRAEALGQPGVDDDGNGYVDDTTGFDFTDVPEIDGAGDFMDRDPDPMDDVGHGTWVTGVAASVGNNGKGGAGVAYGARFMPLRAGFRPRVGFSLGFLAEDDAAAAVVYAVDNGASVLNLSFGDEVRAPILEDAVRYAVDHGVVVVAASGNSGNNNPFYPAGLSGVLAVGASDRDRHRASYSTWGPGVTLLAPGNSLFTTDLGDGYTEKSGTSLASPVAAGVAALIRSIHPSWSASQVVAAITESTDPSTWPDNHGARLLNAAAAVRSDAGATIEITGLDAASTFDDSLEVRGTVQGPAVRGWQVRARRGSGGWITLGMNPRGPAFEERLALWETSSEAEGPALIRVEAFGFDGVLASRDIQVFIDHSAPVITAIQAIPVLAGAGVGLRVTALSDDPVMGELNVNSSTDHYRFQSVVESKDLILGLDGPLGLPGETLAGMARFTNGAGLTTFRSFSIELPSVPLETSVHRSPAPTVRTWLPVIADLDGDGTPEIAGETEPEDGEIYGRVRTFQSGGIVAWTSNDAFIPQDAADFDGDGLQDLLGLGLREARVYSRSKASGFPDHLGWSTTEAWGARFIPAPEGSGFDIVASRDAEIRIYRKSGSTLEIRQTIANPTGGINSISPDIVLVRGGPGHALALATIDGDNDLIVVSRDPDGLFRTRWTMRLDNNNLGNLAAADLDGDGIDELLTVEGVGVSPSPASGLRDGLYRLHVFKDAGEDGYEEAADMGIGAAGAFPGNAVTLARSTLGGSPDGLWWGISDNLYLIRWPDGVPRVAGFWDRVAPGRPATGNFAPGQAPPSPVSVFPGNASDSIAGDFFNEGPVPDSVPISLGISVASVAARGAHVEVVLRWSSARPTFELWRYTGDAETPDFSLQGLQESEFRDTTLVPGQAYVYRVRAERGGETSSLSLMARLDNPIVSATAHGADVEISWRYPVLTTESSLAAIPGTSILSQGLDRTGTRLVLRTNPPLPAGSSPTFVVSGYVSDPRFAIGKPGNGGTIEVQEPRARTTLRAVRIVERTRLVLEFDPAVPEGLNPGDIHFTPDLPVAGLTRKSETILEVGLSDADPLRAGTYRVRVAPDEGSGPGVMEGFGDALSFSVTPIVFPNPVVSGKTVRFDWLSAGSTVTVFDLQGRPVWAGREEGSGFVSWNPEDSDRGTPAPGVYLYSIEGMTTIRGKLAIVR